MHRFAALLLILIALPAAAEPVSWSPPLPGTSMTYEMLLGEETMSSEIEVLAIEGDLVRSRVTTGGSPSEEVSLRGLVNIESAAGSYTFDYDEARALWPLEAGKRVSFEGTGEAGGQSLAFATTLVVEAVEEIETPAGRFLAARIANTTEMVFDGGEATLKTQQWLDAESGMPVMTSVTVTSGGQLVQTVTMTATEGPTAR